MLSSKQAETLAVDEFIGEAQGFDNNSPVTVQNTQKQWI